MTRSIADLLFRPASIVVYGASSDPEKLSGRPLAYLSSFGYSGQVYAVNPRRESVQGFPSYPDVESIPGDVDLAVIVVPASAVLEALHACAAAGVGAAIIFASGFAESSASDAIDQSLLSDLAETSGMRIVGPNCLGSFALPGNVFATFSTAFDDGGEAIDSPIALVSQSGAVGTFTYSMMSATGVGLRYYVNPGNQSDVTVVEVLSALVGAPDVDVLMGHLEDGSDLASFEKLASEAEAAKKPLLILKAGRSAAGSRAIGAHTASRPGDHEELDRIVSERGVVLVPTMEAWADAALLFSTGRRPRGRRVTIMTQSGGAAALASDYAVDAGLVVDTWAEDAERAALAEGLPSFASVANPIDLTGAMINDVELLARSLRQVIDHDETDTVLVVLGNSDKGGDAAVAALVEACATTDKPLIVSWTGGSGRPRADLLAAGIPTYTEPLRAVRAIESVAAFALR